MFRLLFAAFFLPALAGAEIVTVPGVSGRLVNHSALPTQAFQVNLFINCVDAQGQTCNYSETIALVKADGSYAIPDLKIDAGQTDPATREYKLITYVKISDQDPKYPYGAIPGDVIESFKSRSKKTVDLQALKAFTVFATQAGRLNLALKSGRPVADFITGPGRDEGVDIEIDFTGGGFPVAGTLNFEQTGFSKKDWSVLQARHYIVMGELPAAPEVHVKVAQSWTANQKIFKTVFNPDMARTIGRILYDDSLTKGLPAERVVDGTYTDSYVFLDYEKREEIEFADIGFSYATLQVRCVNGQIKGEVIYRDGQFESDPETGRDNVAGTCAGEQGTLRLPLRTKKGNTIYVNAPFSKIRAQAVEVKGKKAVGKLLFSDNVTDSSDRFRGSEVSMMLPMFDDQGGYFGYLTVGTGSL